MWYSGIFGGFRILGCWYVMLVLTSSFLFVDDGEASGS